MSCRGKHQVETVTGQIYQDDWKHWTHCCRQPQQIKNVRSVAGLAKRSRHKQIERHKVTLGKARVLTRQQQLGCVFERFSGSDQH